MGSSPSSSNKYCGSIHGLRIFETPSLDNGNPDHRRFVCHGGTNHTQTHVYTKRWVPVSMRQGNVKFKLLRNRMVVTHRDVAEGVKILKFLFYPTSREVKDVVCYDADLETGGLRYVDPVPISIDFYWNLYRDLYPYNHHVRRFLHCTEIMLELLAHAKRGGKDNAWGQFVTSSMFDKNLIGLIMNTWSGIETRFVS